MMMMDSDTDKEDRGLCLFGDTHNCCDEETLGSTTLEEKEPHKIMKTNLRKSLAWDKAFFTNAGKYFFSGCVLWICYLVVVSFAEISWRI